VQQLLSVATLGSPLDKRHEQPDTFRVLPTPVQPGGVRDIEQELIPLCNHKGLGVVVWSPLAGGFLSGKYKPQERLVSGTRSQENWAYPERYFAANADETLNMLLHTAIELQKTPAQVALRWVLDQPAITSAIVGARTVEQLRDNLKCSGWTIEKLLLERLNSVSRLPDRYPESMEKQMHLRRDTAVRIQSLSSQ